MPELENVAARIPKKFEQRLGEILQNCSQVPPGYQGCVRTDSGTAIRVGFDGEEVVMIFQSENQQPPIVRLTIGQALEISQKLLGAARAVNAWTK